MILLRFVFFSFALFCCLLGLGLGLGFDCCLFLFLLLHGIAWYR